MDEISSSVQRGIRSPWAVGQLSGLVLADLFGVDALPVSRPEAMSLPALARARNKVVSAIAQCPLKVYAGDAEVEAPTWIYRGDGLSSPQHRMAWTVDDLIFSGWSLWAVERGQKDQILAAVRCPADRWLFQDGVVYVDGEEVDASSVILIPGLHEGVTAFAARTIRQSRNLEEIVAHRAANPVPATELHQVTDDELEDSEIQAMVDDYMTALNSAGGSVVYSPKSVEMRVHGSMPTDLLIDARNASSVDQARVVGVPATMVDATGINSTLTYETIQGRNLQFVDDLTLYLLPIEARLSMDDVTPRGTRVAFDRAPLTALMPPPSGAPTPD